MQALLAELWLEMIGFLLTVSNRYPLGACQSLSHGAVPEAPDPASASSCTEILLIL